MSTLRKFTRFCAAILIPGFTLVVVPQLDGSHTHGEACVCDSSGRPEVHPEGTSSSRVLRKCIPVFCIYTQTTIQLCKILFYHIFFLWILYILFPGILPLKIARQKTETTQGTGYFSWSPKVLIFYL